MTSSTSSSACFKANQHGVSIAIGGPLAGQGPLRHLLPDLQLCESRWLAKALVVGTQHHRMHHPLLTHPSLPLYITTLQSTVHQHNHSPNASTMACLPVPNFSSKRPHPTLSNNPTVTTAAPSRPLTIADFKSADDYISYVVQEAKTFPDTQT
jgi:hypothetical protein